MRYALFLLLALLTVAPVSATERVAYLIVLEAASAKIENGRISLEGTGDRVVFFADRPFREVHAETLQDLFDSWIDVTDSFKSDPPNAAVTGMEDGEPVELVVELSRPQLQNKVLSFDIMRLDGPDVAGLKDVSVLIDISFGDILKGAK
ncbi:hypothetical protein [Roseibium sp. LAB1]